MGITDLSLLRINRYLKPNDSILIIGCQNLYNAENYMQVAQPYFQGLGHTVRSIDILGCNGSEIADLREPLELGQFDMVNDCGSKEHIDGPLYIPFRNIHNACKVGGVMIHENPMTGNWPGHGQHYFTEAFYTALAEACGYDVFELCSETAMGNTTDGWNISTALRKGDKPFITKKQSDKIYADHIFSK